MPYLLRISLVLALACTSVFVSASAFGESEKALIVEPGMEMTDANALLDIFVVNNASLTPADLTQLQNFSTEALQQAQGSHNFGFSEDIYWVRLRLKNPGDTDIEVVVEQDYPLIDYVDFWYQGQDGEWVTYSTGDRLPFDARPISTRQMLFPVPIPAQSEVPIYVKYRSQGPLNIGLSVGSKLDYYHDQEISQLFYGMYYGGFLVLVLYNLIIFIAIKDRIYIFYMGFAINYGLYMSFHNGLAFQYLLPNHPALANHLLMIVLGLAVIFGTQFSRRVCNLKRQLPFFDSLTQGFLWLCVLLLVVTPLFHYHIMIVLWSIMITMVCTLILVFAILSALKGNVASRPFLLGWSTLLITALIYMLKSFGVLPHNVFTQNSFQIGSLIEMVLLSLAIGSRYIEVRRISYSDSLSTLGNRRQFNEQLPAEFEHAQKTGYPLSMILIDIDHFKKVNDTHGHSVGDEVLIIIGKLLHSQMRKPNIACRYGGEEFAVILPRTDESSALVAAERIRALIDNTPMKSLNITVSIGVACSSHQDISSSQRLIEAADKALYQSKHSGRNRVTAFSEQSQQDLSAVQA